MGDKWGGTISFRHTNPFNEMPCYVLSLKPEGPEEPPVDMPSAVGS
jgi:hypothetical protein